MTVLFEGEYAKLQIPVHSITWTRIISQEGMFVSWEAIQIKGTDRGIYVEEP